VDFGIARHFQPQITATMIGTHGYAPPELYSDKVEARSDRLNAGDPARREEDATVTVHEVAAGRLAETVGDPPDVRAISVHHVLLIARSSIAGALKNQTLAVVAEIGFGVLAAVRELADIPEMGLFWLGWDQDWLERNLPWK